MRELGLANEAALQGYFAQRLGRYLEAHGRALVGWDEILEGGVPPDAMVMSWRGDAGRDQPPPPPATMRCCRRIRRCTSTIGRVAVPTSRRDAAH